MMRDLLARFVAAFARGIEGELAAMRTSAEAFEIALGRGDDLGAHRYTFELAAPTDRLVAGASATLRTARGEQRVIVERAERVVTLIATAPIDLAATPVAIVVAPWFLYERLVAALGTLDVDRHGVALALRLFGKLPHTRAPVALRGEHAELDPSQRAAVQLCGDSDLAFVWGPPGTGKTMTLAHVVEELLARGERILLASTTNAAIDQVLAKLATRPWFAAAVEAGTVIRLGRSDAETFGTELAEVADRIDAARKLAMERLRRRVGEVESQLRYTRAQLAEHAVASAPQQSLFAPPTVRPPAQQLRALETRIARLERVRTLARAKLAAHAAAGRDLEARLVTGARVVACTLTTAYLAPVMVDQRFDALIAEEAGMATLPPLFYAACLCERRAIVVGDPRQLPPIVQSSDETVHRAIGRNVFEVTVPDPARSEVVAMLDVQYRMHPAIGAIVGGLFYDGRLVHRADPAAVDAIVAGPPFAGEAAVVVDTRGRTTCLRAPKGTSRINPGSAELVADLAVEAVRGGARSIGVITPYAAQASEIRRLLAARRIADAVECSTIHRFQGRECDVVILDLVDAAPMQPSTLVGDANLLNVSISRARGKLVVVADVAYFGSAAPGGTVARLLAAIGSARRC